MIAFLSSAPPRSLRTASANENSNWFVATCEADRLPESNEGTNKMLDAR